MGIQQRVSWSNTYSSVGPPSSVASEVTDRARRLCPPLGKHMVAHQALGNGVMRPGAPSARPTGHFEREGGKKDMLRAALHKMREIPEGSSREAALQSLQEWCCDRGYGKGLVHRPSTQEPASDDLSALLLHSIVSDNMAAAHLLLDQQVLGYALDVNIVSRGDGAATPTAASDAGLAAVADAALRRGPARRTLSNPSSDAAQTLRLRLMVNRPSPRLQPSRPCRRGSYRPIGATLS
jgi:hypothetical protein